MKRFEFLVLLAIVQMGVIMAGTVEIQNGLNMFTVYSDSELGKNLVASANSIEDFTINARSLSNGSWVSTSSTSITYPAIPFLGVEEGTFFTFNAPDITNLVTVFNSAKDAFLQIGFTMLFILFSITSGSMYFYQMILYALLPNIGGVNKGVVIGFAFFLSLIQSILVAYEIFKSIKSVYVGATGASVNLSEDEEGIRRGGGRGLPYSEAGGLE